MRSRSRRNIRRSRHSKARRLPIRRQRGRRIGIHQAVQRPRAVLVLRRGHRKAIGSDEVLQLSDTFRKSFNAFLRGYSVASKSSVDTGTQWKAIRRYSLPSVRPVVEDTAAVLQGALSAGGMLSVALVNGLGNRSIHWVKWRRGECCCCIP